MSEIEECLSELATQPLLYTDTIHGDQVMRDDLWVVSTDELNENHNEITRLNAIIKENEDDAERYRYLRNNTSIMTFEQQTWVTSHKLDMRVDEAMRVEGE